MQGDGVQYRLGFPDRVGPRARRLDLAEIGSLTFERPDFDRFPALRVALNALAQGNGLPTVLNAANEVAVAAFLDRKIGFLDIAATVARTLERLDAEGALEGGGDPLERAADTNATARRVARDIAAGALIRNVKVPADAALEAAGRDPGSLVRSTQALLFLGPDGAATAEAFATAAMTRRRTPLTLP